jgi:hypothetical protein
LWAQAVATMADPTVEIEMDSHYGGRRSHGVDSEVMVTSDDLVAVVPSLET